MFLWLSYKKKIWEKNIFFPSLKSLKKEVGSGVGSEVGSGSISQRYRSADPDSDPHQKVMDPQHWKKSLNNFSRNLCRTRHKSYPDPDHLKGQSSAIFRTPHDE